MAQHPQQATIEQATIALADALTPDPSPLAAAWRAVAIQAARLADTQWPDSPDLYHALTDALASMVRS